MKVSLEGFWRCNSCDPGQFRRMLAILLSENPELIGVMRDMVQERLGPSNGDLTALQEVLGEMEAEGEDSLSITWNAILKEIASRVEEKVKEKCGEA